MPASARRRIATLLSFLVAACAVATTASAATPPSISDLPSIVKSGSGADQLAVAFPRTPSANTLRAAIAAASAFAGMAQRPVTITSYVAPTRQQILDSPVSVIEMDPRPGPARVALSYLDSGSLLLELSGQGQGLVNAAKLLSTRWVSTLDTADATLPAGLTADVAKLDMSPHGSEKLAAGSVSGDGSLTITRQVQIPVDKVIDKGKAIFRLGVEYNAPGGGRLTVKLNGWTLSASHERGAGNTFVYRERIASVWTDGPNLLPGYYLDPGENTLTITARPSRPQLVSRVGAQLALTTHSNLQMTLTQRRPTTQLELWPFPLYDGNWTHTTVVMAPAAQLDQRSLSTLISALANTERLTGNAADPAISFAAPTASQRRGNLLVYGNPETLAGITPSTPLVPGLITEQKLTGGGYALLATDQRAMAAFADDYNPGNVDGQTVVIDANDTAHTIVGAGQPNAFKTPQVAWLKPAAAIAAIVLMWVVGRVFLARRRLRKRAPLPPGGVIA